MTKLKYEVSVAVPITDIYNYASSPRNWAEWYPGTTEVEGAPVGPLQVGDTWGEAVEIAGMRMQLSWRATEVEAPYAWTIEGSGNIHGPFKFVMQGGTAMLRHRLEEKEGYTRYRREITIRYSNPFLKLANRLFLARKTAAELEDGLQCLKRILEDRHTTKSTPVEDVA